MQSAEQSTHRDGHNGSGGCHVADVNILIWLVGHFENARPIRYAIPDAPDYFEVLVVVSTRRKYVLRPAVQDLWNGRVKCLYKRRCIRSSNRRN